MNKYNITKETLEDCISKGYTRKQIAEYYKCSLGTISLWLRKFRLTTFNKEVKCKICGETDSRQFSNHRSVCKSCNTKRCVAYGVQKKKELIKSKGGKCSICGYDKYYGALEFHHLDPQDKTENIMNAHKWAKKPDELAKCIIVCANCHREIHGGITRWNTDHKEKEDEVMLNIMAQRDERSSLHLYGN